MLNQHLKPCSWNLGTDYRKNITNLDDIYSGMLLTIAELDQEYGFECRFTVSCLRSFFLGQCMAGLTNSLLSFNFLSAFQRKKFSTHKYVEEIETNFERRK